MNIFVKMGLNYKLTYFIFVYLNLFRCQLAEETSEELESDVIYYTPKAPKNSYGFEPLDDLIAFKKFWVQSQAKKDEADETIAKYDGIWELESSAKNALTGDRGLVLKSKAKHSAIAFKLSKPFHFENKPLVVQYEVQLQNGQECGGAYIKLLSHSEKGVDLKNFNDKTPYTIMFGPDKCGNDHKLHFIFRHVNPLSKNIEEKHCKKPKSKLDTPFTDKLPHLYTLILRPDNTFEIFFDHELINSGHLLEDFTPAVTPVKEIENPKDKKPKDWDESEKIPDPNAKKPEDWNEDAPAKIVDNFATKPDAWLEDEPEYIAEPGAKIPEDWDNEMDGEWEPPMVPNPVCEGAPGCGPWSQPMIDNPEYKGKWQAPMIDNPNYKGKWVPRRIPNPDYFEDLEPFKMTPIGAVGLELWSLSDGIYFDNFLITDDVDEARVIASQTFDLKLKKQPGALKNLFTQFLDFSNERPWIYAIYILVLAVPVVLVVMCCFTETTKKDDAYGEAKKTDKPTKDDDVANEEQINEKVEKMSENEEGPEENGEKTPENEDVASEESDKNVEGTQSEKSESEPEENHVVRTSPRLRKMRKE